MRFPGGSSAASLPSCCRLWDESYGLSYGGKPHGDGSAHGRRFGKRCAKTSKSCDVGEVEQLQQVFGVVVGIEPNDVYDFCS